MRHTSLVVLIGGLAVAGGILLLKPSSVPEAEAIGPQEEATPQEVPDKAPLAWLTEEERTPASPPEMPTETARTFDELNLATLADLLAAGDKAACEQFIMDWFADGPKGVDRMLELMASLSEAGEGAACGLLLQSAMALMGPYSDRFEPWDRSSLITATMGLLDSNALASGVAMRGLAGYGSEASGEDIGTLIGLQSGSDDPLFADQGTQIQQIQLIQSWAKDLTPEALEQLKSLAFDRGSWDVAYRKLALRVALSRDGGAAGQFYAELLAQVANDKGEDSYAYSGSVKEFTKAAIYAHLDDTPEEKVRYLDELRDFPDLVGAVVTALDEEQADAVLSSMPSGALDEFTRDVLGSMGTGEDRFDATLRALGAPQFRELSTPSQLALVKRALDHGDWTAVQSNLEAPPSSEATATKKYWSMMTTISRGTKDQDLIEAVIVPWLVATESAPSPERTKLVGELSERFPDLEWLE